MLGEYPAFITVWAFVVDAILAGGAVARSWSSYLAQLVCQLPPGRLLQCGHASGFTCGMEQASCMHQPRPHAYADGFSLGLGSA